MKKYRINIDMNASQDVYVSAKNVRDAKKKAWEKFTKKKSNKKFFTIWADTIVS